MIYNAYLAFKYRPRLTVWGKIVAGWVVVSLPWMLALAWYTATGHLDGRFEPIVALSVVASALSSFIATMIYDTECEESPKWSIISVYKKCDEDYSEIF